MPSSRFLTLDDLAAELAISRAQTYAPGPLRRPPGLKLGGRGQWRVEPSELEDFIRRLYAETAEFVREHS